ncbi:MAG: GNAT family protein [Lachnospiraceae bacterium]|nr:GNAT family protein [Lachnospiraceae bacterium]
MKIRKAETKDLEPILSVMDAARAFMRSSGNFSQWNGMNYPGYFVEGDIEKGNGYVAENDCRVCGYFAFIKGDDPCYRKIEGDWLDNELPYAAIHRVASDGTCSGLMEAILAFAFTNINNIRIDTHEDNAPMRHKLDKNGFTYCGTVWMTDGSPRRAYQKIIL